jgi:hypothetical protein
MAMTAVSQKSRRLSVGFCTRALICVELPKKVFTSRAK